MSNILDFDELKMYLCKPYVINEYITLTLPTIGQIIDYGEQEYDSMIFVLTAIPSDLKSQLFDMGLDYEELTDFELFALLTRGLTPKDTSILFGDELDFSAMSFLINPLNNKPILRDEERGYIIDELAYMKICNYLRKAHDIKPKVQKAANKRTKRVLLELDRQRVEQAKNEPYKSRLKPLISAMMRYPGFKYKLKELVDCGIYEFMDTVKGANIYISATCLLQGSYSGMIDTQKIPKENFDWMKSPSD